jgi:small conductance mechanosensitive channel
MMHHLACRIKIPAFYSREETLFPHSEDKYKRAKRNAIGPRWIVVTLFLVALSVNYVHAQVKPSANEQKATQSQAQQPSPPPTLQQKPDQTSDAEMISGVGQLHEMDRRRLRQIQAELENVDIEYKRAGKEFEQLDKTLAKMKDQIKGEENKPATTSKAKETVALEKHWQLAKDRFDLVIQQRKMLQTQIATLEGKIRLEKKALDRLAGITKPDSAGPMPTPAGPPVGVEPDPSTGLEMFGLPNIPSITPPTEQPATPGAKVTPAANDQEIPTEALLQARNDLDEKRADLNDARNRLQEIDRAIKFFETELRTEQQLLEIARKQASNAEQIVRAMNEDISGRSGAASGVATLTDSRRKSQEADGRLQMSRAEAEQRIARTEALEAQLDRVKTSRTTIEDRYQEASEAVGSARQKVEWLEGPLAPQKIFQWFYKSGPKILASVLFMGFLLWLSRVLGHRIVRAIASRSGPGSIEEREKRTETLVGVFNNGTTVAIIIFGTLTLLQAAGINVTVLLGGAAVVGVAVAFGAQNLTRDYFSGFVMLLENQYDVNDIVKIGGTAGLVERITLRMTVLRDLEGVVHFIPHGEVKTVSNLTQGWSRALFDIGVAYKEDADRVMKVLVELGKELRQDPYYGDLIMDDPEMLGVDSFGDSAVVIKFFIKTRPQKQFTIKRELLRRIKRKFDELGIEIPFPHRTVYHRSGDNSPVNRNGPVSEAIVGNSRKV